MNHWIPFSGFMKFVHAVEQIFLNKIGINPLDRISVRFRRGHILDTILRDRSVQQTGTGLSKGGGMEMSWSIWGQALASCKDVRDVSSVAYQLEPLCPNQEEWGNFCDGVLDLGWPKGMVEEAVEFARNPGKVELAMKDNYFVEAVRLVLGKGDPSMPAIAWAAFNKHTYKGWADECATVRFLTWAGFDVNEPGDYGQTPLHYMAATKVNSGSHPRAVAFLLDAGANPNAKRQGGDSPLTALFGNVQWTKECHESAYLLLRAGANPHQPSEDGATPFSVLVENQKQNPTGGRAAIIAEIEAGVIAGSLKAPSKAKAPRKAAKSRKRRL